MGLAARFPGFAWHEPIGRLLSGRWLRKANGDAPWQYLHLSGAPRYQHVFRAPGEQTKGLITSNFGCKDAGRGRKKPQKALD